MEHDCVMAQVAVLPVWTPRVFLIDKVAIGV